MRSPQRTMTRSGVEGAAGGVCVLRIGLKPEDFAGTEGSGGSEGGAASAGGIEESGIPIDTHLEEVLKSDDGFFVGVDVSGCWGNDAVGFGSDDLAVVSPAEESRVINSAWASRSVWSDSLIFTSLPYKWIGIEDKAVELLKSFPCLAVMFRREPKE